MAGVEAGGGSVVNDTWFDTVQVRAPGAADEVKAADRPVAAGAGRTAEIEAAREKGRKAAGAGPSSGPGTTS